MKIGHGQVERRPCQQDEAERAQSAKVLDDEWEQPKLGNHGIDSLDGEHEADSLRWQTKTTGKLEGQDDRIVGLGRTEEDRHQLIEGHAVTVERLLSAIMQVKVACRLRATGANSLGQDAVSNNGEDDLSSERLGRGRFLSLNIDVALVCSDVIVHSPSHAHVHGAQARR